MQKTARVVVFGMGKILVINFLRYEVILILNFFSMPRVNGIVNLQGSYDNMTFFNREGKSFFRKKGGVSKQRIENDPNFVRTRENMSEFSTNISAGKLLRLSLGSLVFKAKDSRLSNRLMKTMSAIKNLDTSSARGERVISLGIATPEGKRQLTGFDFNSNAPLDSVLFANYTLDNATGKVEIPNIMLAEQLRFPEGANFASFQCGVLNLDFETGLSELVLSTVTNLPIDLTTNTIELVPAAMPTGTGVNIYVLMISFYQAVNGVQYSLKNEEFNVLHIVDVS
ncbi:hypothetical protein [Flavobacterium dankookense]|uniref:Uncharacterized protein n=1 Tax=Flavobacterium dankookense TaxID=706186 RepID=A0A4R6Q7M5_9FLAO|nr:hypothetical protein [Flavobacterium dankookense]TDP57623.1 hypothetical protein BC748_2838 [Flavobacterium dankookense]